MATIDVDAEVLAYLESRARGFGDTPNAVLRRELLRRAEPAEPGSGMAAALPTFPPDTPAALVQILWVAYGVRRLGLSRHEATNLVARHLGLTAQTVQDKYCRQLGIRADGFGLMLREPELAHLARVLMVKFPEHSSLLKELLAELRGG
jgi:hypothetical protein